MDNLLGDRPSVNPVATASSTGAETARSTDVAETPSKFFWFHWFPWDGPHAELSFFIHCKNDFNHESVICLKNHTFNLGIKFAQIKDQSKVFSAKSSVLNIQWIIIIKLFLSIIFLGFPVVLFPLKEWLRFTVLAGQTNIIVSHTPSYNYLNCAPQNQWKERQQVGVTKSFLSPCASQEMQGRGTTTREWWPRKGSWRRKWSWKRGNYF